MSDRKEFLAEAKEVRNEFAKVAGQYSVDEHLQLRTEIDTLLIMYDQACERVRVGGKPETSVSACIFKSVIARYFFRVLGLPFFIALSLIGAFRGWFIYVINYCVWGGEAAVYTKKRNPKTIADIFDEVQKNASTEGG